ncbi:AIM24 family protein [Paenibacillus polymyxa]|uniref:Tryptophan RNA-binding attenuation protein n=1 Tax=Paenibacillus polymyxa (strain SC2) TaxID=886882 RepID=E3ELE5_PAEPS|nr:AIM24 family protein [Paenibacillus polymyxa]ADO59977.1 tryptophan RNA-binding attenuation protein [Paenibacillus polymyxa SC2]WPQ59805.1 AIM24 family protein [Paenibacillus polymyxa]
MPFQFEVDRELFLKATGDGHFFAKKGTMVADQGKFKYSKRLLGTNEGNIVGRVLNHVGRRVTGENLEIMEVEGSGMVFLSDQEAHVTIITLEDNGPWQNIKVESEDLLAFTEQCHYGVSIVGTGILSQRGLFTSQLSFNGYGAQVAIKTKGNPLVLQAPCRVDPDAVVAWTGANPTPKLDVNLKTFIGQTSGESYMYEFNEPGQIVIVQPFERESGVKFGIDDKRYQPEEQSSAFKNTFGGGLGGMAQGGQPQGQQSGIGGLIGNLLGGGK